MSLTGKQTTTASIPGYQKNLAKAAGRRAQDVMNMPYAPYYGPDVAAFAPQEMAAMRGANDLAAAFGMRTAPVSMPAPQNYGGFSAYSSGGMYDAALEELRQRDPELFAMLTGQAPQRAPSSFGRLSSEPQGRPTLLSGLVRPGTRTGDPMLAFLQGVGAIR